MLTNVCLIIGEFLLFQLLHQLLIKFLLIQLLRQLLSEFLSFQLLRQLLIQCLSFQLLRQLLDDRVLCTHQKPFELRIVEGLTVFSAMALTDYPAIPNRELSERLLVGCVCVSLVSCCNGCCMYLSECLCVCVHARVCLCLVCLCLRKEGRGEVLTSSERL